MGTITHKTIDTAFQKFSDHISSLFPDKYSLTWNAKFNDGTLSRNGKDTHLTGTVIRIAKEFGLHVFAVDCENGRAIVQLEFKEFGS